MRRLLFFGTGAAVIGILFLIIAFYESYLIVSSLQRQLGQVVIDTNRLLEDAGLEAIFLGIMAAVGYALISKGLDGIRREALLEAEGTAEVTFGRGKIASHKDRSRYVARSVSDKSLSPRGKQASVLHPGIKQRIQPSALKSTPPIPGTMQVNQVSALQPSVKVQSTVPDVSEKQTTDGGLVKPIPEEADGETIDASTTEDNPGPPASGT